MDKLKSGTKVVYKLDGKSQATVISDAEAIIYYNNHRGGGFGAQFVKQVNDAHQREGSIVVFIRWNTNRTVSYMNFNEFILYKDRLPNFL